MLIPSSAKRLQASAIHQFVHLLLQAITINLINVAKCPQKSFSDLDFKILHGGICITQRPQEICVASITSIIWLLSRHLEVMNIIQCSDYCC